MRAREGQGRGGGVGETHLGVYEPNAAACVHNGLICLTCNGRSHHLRSAANFRPNPKFAHMSFSISCCHQRPTVLSRYSDDGRDKSRKDDPPGGRLFCNLQNRSTRLARRASTSGILTSAAAVAPRPSPANSSVCSDSRFPVKGFAACVGMSTLKSASGDGSPCPRQCVTYAEFGSWM